MFRKKGKKQVVDDTNALEMTDQTKKKTRLSTGSEGSHHSRDSTQMPSDWAKHLTEDGKSDRYYMNTETGETQWEHTLSFAFELLTGTVIQIHTAQRHTSKQTRPFRIGGNVNGGNGIQASVVVTKD